MKYLITVLGYTGLTVAAAVAAPPGKLDVPCGQCDPVLGSLSGSSVSTDLRTSAGCTTFPKYTPYGPGHCFNYHCGICMIFE